MPHLTVSSSSLPPSTSSVVEIPLRHARGVALVDAADAPLVAPYRWRVLHGYAIAPVGRGARPREVLMHRLLLDVTRRDLQVDHVDGDRLNNRRANLRLATAGENQRNRRCVRGAVPYKGVTRHLGGKYQAQVKCNGRTSYVGLFDDPLEAALAYWARAQELFGAWAWCQPDVRAEADRRAQLAASASASASVIGAIAPVLSAEATRTPQGAPAAA